MKDINHRGLYFRITTRFWETAHLPLPKTTLTLTSHLGQNVALKEGWVGSFPETFNTVAIL